jgi:hypothetical protein
MMMIPTSCWTVATITTTAIIIIINDDIVPLADDGPTTDVGHYVCCYVPVQYVGRPVRTRPKINRQEEQKAAKKKKK